MKETFPNQTLAQRPILGASSTGRRNTPKANTSQLSSPLHQKDTHHDQSPQNNIPSKHNPRFTRPEATEIASYLNHLEFSSRDASSLWVSCRIFSLVFFQRAAMCTLAWSERSGACHWERRSNVRQSGWPIAS